MLGCYDFCGHYDWTFRWLKQEGGEVLLYRYWKEAICDEAQRHAARRIVSKGLQGMAEYWEHSLDKEAPDGGYAARIEGDRFVLEMTECPSRGFLIRNGIDFSGDYCDHCIGWVGPMMKEAGYVVNHLHNHEGQCWWEFVPRENAGPTPPAVLSLKDRLRRQWKKNAGTLDFFDHASGCSAKRKSAE